MINEVIKGGEKGIKLTPRPVENIERGQTSTPTKIERWITCVDVSQTLSCTSKFFP
jgi:hypothetical protein